MMRALACMFCSGTVFLALCLVGGACRSDTMPDAEFARSNGSPGCASVPLTHEARIGPDAASERVRPWANPPREDRTDMGFAMQKGLTYHWTVVGYINGRDDQGRVSPPRQLPPRQVWTESVGEEGDQVQFKITLEAPLDGLSCSEVPTGSQDDGGTVYRDIRIKVSSTVTCRRSSVPAAIAAYAWGYALPGPDVTLYWERARWSSESCVLHTYTHSYGVLFWRDNPSGRVRLGIGSHLLGGSSPPSIAGGDVVSGAYCLELSEIRESPELRD